MIKLIEQIVVLLVSLGYTNIIIASLFSRARWIVKLYMYIFRHTWWKVEIDPLGEVDSVGLGRAREGGQELRLPSH